MMENNALPYQAKHKIRIISAASLFDGHDAAINIMRRILQSSGCEVIHLGHNRSAEEIVSTAIQEDVQGIAITSYQGGHVEFFKYIYDLLKEKKSSHIKVFGGGGGTILPTEIEELHNYGITRIYSPDDGRKLGLQGMINDLISQCDFDSGIITRADLKSLDSSLIPKLISCAENHPEEFALIKPLLNQSPNKIPIIGITGTGGAGKSSLVDELVRRFIKDFPQKKLGIISVDPSKRKTGGALLGDRIRMNAIHHPNVYMRSLATRQANLALSKYIPEALDILKSFEFDLLILETSGIGQSDTEIVDYCDLSLYVMTPEFGAASQLEKIDMLDFANLIAINKFDKRGALDALRDVKKQYARNRKIFDAQPDQLPVYATIASQFNDPGTNQLYLKLLELLSQKFNIHLRSSLEELKGESQKIHIIPPQRTRYLSEITETIRKDNEECDKQAMIAEKLYSINVLTSEVKDEKTLSTLTQLRKDLETKISPDNLRLIHDFDLLKTNLSEPEFTYKIRDHEIKVQTTTESLSHQKIPKVSLPKFKSWGPLLQWLLQENVPGSYPFTAGVFPFKREQEDPTRMFAGEGTPERTNRRFHYVSQNLPAKRLSTAFDSVTLYGENPGPRPDIYGKIGNAGVSIASLDDAKKLYSGFNLIETSTSVSMTINGPAPILTAYFMNAAIDQQCEIHIRNLGLEEKVKKILQKTYGKNIPEYEGKLPKGNDGLGLLLLGTTGDQVLDRETYEKIKKDTISKVRGTVQADILKEDQAQNTCIFSTEFALQMMGDMQEFFIENKVRNFYSVSISGYHIAEAGANPITQLALTLANGFTYLEYYLSRGMKVNDFAQNFSFFFSNGVDPEYAVIGRVARRIWAKALKLKYGANERAQKLKYHIQTSGRSLHAQEIDFNDIRTSLQALYAISDNCNSLHTNAFDEAITTPTESSVRRAIAIQMIINHELGLTKNQNPLQGSFIIEELTNMVETAVLKEFDAINERGGVLGAMETMYQRSKIQEESLYYETLKHDGRLPIIGVNTFLNSQGSPTIIPKEIIRSTETEKKLQIENTLKIQESFAQINAEKLKALELACLKGNNVFKELLETSKTCTLGEITHRLYMVGGQYRRNM